MKNIENLLIDILCDILQKKPEEINPEMTLFNDLKIESIEILEIVFRLEQEFKIKILKNELWHLPNFILEKNLYANGRFSDEAITLITKNIQTMTPQKIEKINSIHDLIGYISVADLCSLIERKYNKIEHTVAYDAL